MKKLVISLTLITLFLLNSNVFAGFYVITGAGGKPVGTEITSLPATISSSGFYYITKDLACTTVASHGITIEADNVTLNLMGFSLIGPSGVLNSSNNGIYMDQRTNITITNGTVRDFSSNGIHAESGFSHQIIDVRVINNRLSGIYLSGTNFQVRGCSAQGNEYRGIDSGSGSQIVGNTAVDNGNSGIYGGDGSTFANNIARGNQATGIYGFGSFTNNSAYQNQGDGIYGSGSFINNSARGNQGNGISAYGSITNNMVFFNQEAGILVRPSYGSLVKNNNVINNNPGDDPFLGGIVVSSNSRIVGNNVAKNRVNGIYVVGTDNIIDDNHVTGSSYGVNFFTTGNLYRDNTAAGITSIEFAGSATNGGGNVIF